MYAIEFETVVEDKTIHLPDEYAEFDSKNVEVILMMDHNKTQNKPNEKENNTPFYRF